MSLSEFFHAGGYGFYIWSSFGATALLMFGEIALLRQQRRTILKRLSRMLRMNANSGSES